ncbi:MAG: hypothetical protein KDF65_16075 [Anaerolineae bacterium]|nr:hypothetical protein [Anaerolineae bacterium]
MSEQPVMEIAIRKVKEGQDNAFVAARSNFISLLKTQTGIEKDWEFESFFTMPEPDDTAVFVGMTRYDSMETVGRLSEKLMRSPEAQAFFGTFDMKAFVLVTPADGQSFKLEEVITNANQVVEVAVRTPKAGLEEQFPVARDAFFKLVAAQPGYIMDREFIDQQSGANVVLIAWETLEDFQNALGAMQTKEEMGAFFGVIEVQAYQALQLTSNA